MILYRSFIYLLARLCLNVHPVLIIVFEPESSEAFLVLLLRHHFLHLVRRCKSGLESRATDHFYCVIDDVSHDTNFTLLSESDSSSNGLVLDTWIPLEFCDEDAVGTSEIQSGY